MYKRFIYNDEETNYMVSREGKIYNCKTNRIISDGTRRYIEFKIKGKRIYRNVNDLIKEVFGEYNYGFDVDSFKRIIINEKESDYIINDKGEIYSEKRCCFINPYETKDGYLRVHLRQDNKDVMFLVHRLVAELFIDNPNNYEDVHHIDFDKKNNHISNLKWLSHDEHAIYHKNL